MVSRGGDGIAHPSVVQAPAQGVEVMLYLSIAALDIHHIEQGLTGNVAPQVFAHQCSIALTLSVGYGCHMRRDDHIGQGPQRMSRW